MRFLLMLCRECQTEASSRCCEYIHDLRDFAVHHNRKPVAHDKEIVSQNLPQLLPNTVPLRLVRLIHATHAAAYTSYPIYLKSWVICFLDFANAAPDQPL